jgi:hypothetical protein
MNQYVGLLVNIVTLSYNVTSRLSSSMVGLGTSYINNINALSISVILTVTILTFTEKKRSNGGDTCNN